MTSDEKIPSAETANPTAAELKLRDGGVTAVEYFNRASKIDHRPHPGAELCAGVQWRAGGVVWSPTLPSMQQSASPAGWEARLQPQFWTFLKL